METKKLSRHWFHIPLQITVAAFCSYWHWHVPLPSIAVLLLGGVAAIMALVEMWPLHKVIYFALIVWLMFIETDAIHKDRADLVRDEESRRREERRQFTGVGDTITNNVQKVLDQSNEQFTRNMERSNRIITGIGDTLKTETGGDSFAFVTFTPQPNGQFLVAITSRGKYPLREIHATLMDDERRVQAMQEFNKHPEGNWIAAIQAGDTYYRVPYLRPQSPEAPSGDVEMLGAYPFGAKDTNDLTIAFSSLNGYWNERLHLRRVDGKWHQALSVMGPTTKQALHPFIYSDSDFPEGRAVAEKDWPHTKLPSQQ